MPTKKQDLLSLTDIPSASQVVAWLNAFSPDPKTPNEVLMMHMGKELFTKIFPDTDWQDALKPYATMKKKGVEPRQAKYSSLFYSANKDEWQKAKELYTDRDSYYYVETLVHLAAVDKWLSDTQDIYAALPFNYKLALARCITFKTVTVTKAEGEAKTDLKDLASEIKAIPHDKVLDTVNTKIGELLGAPV